MVTHGKYKLLYGVCVFSVDELFSCISECQRLYPDSQLSSEEDESAAMVEEGNFYTTPEGLQDLSAEGESVLRHLENILHINEAQENGNVCHNACHNSESRFSCMATLV